MVRIKNSFGRKDNFVAKARRLSFLPTSLDIFDIQHHLRILYVYTCYGLESQLNRPLIEDR